MLPASADILCKIELDRNGELPIGQKSNLVYSETDAGCLKIKNFSKVHSIRNIYVLCSHPIVFDFYMRRLETPDGKELVLQPDEEVQIPINFRATLMG